MMILFRSKKDDNRTKSILSEAGGLLMRNNYWEGKDIRLRALEAHDIDRFVEMRNDPDSEGKWFYDRLLFPESAEDMRKQYADLLLDLKGDKSYFIIETLDGEVAGNIGVWHTQRREGIFRYGVFIEEEHRRKGYGRQALIIVLDYYFNELNYQKCSATVYEYNKRSQEFQERFGFVREGSLRNELYTRGSYYDEIYYGMLREEFNGMYKHWFSVNCT